MNRKFWHRQMDVKSWPGKFLSPINLAVVLLIMFSLILDVLATEPSIQPSLETFLGPVEWLIVGLFTLEYLLRVWTCVERPAYAGRGGRLKYIVSPFALIDLVAILPSYLPAGELSLTWFRAVRLLRVAKLARFGAFSIALDSILDVIRNRRYELLVSVSMMLFLILAASAGIYAVEGDSQPEAFGSIPRSMWWAIATLTTVGYGDVTPTTPLGRSLAAAVSLLGIALVAIPTGILAASFSEVVQRRHQDRRRDDSD